MAMAKTYSARNSGHFLDLVRQIKPSAAAYIENIEKSGVLWKCSQFGNVKNTFKRNVFPVSLDGIQFDGVTKPPLVSTRASGRPRTRRIRSEFLAAEDLPVVCSNCAFMQRS